ncbi:uncharacterized protein [Montipora foliosa]|uniref:uncharacterized protein isoform X2 n=1 Tax=Montipora foliosa TaxID=591990 RepID=UPI0035F185E9
MTYPHGNISMEVQTLRKALNFPVHHSGPTSLSTEWFDKTKYGSKNGLDHLTDSGYSSRMSAQSTSDIQNSEALGYSSLGFDSNSNQVRHNSSFSNHDVNPWGTSFNSPRVFERSLKSSFDESKRLVLLEKLREAHLTIQNQAEKLVEGKSEISCLRGQLESLGAGQEGLQKEVDSITKERKTFEVFKSHSLKSREHFLTRLNDLDKALQVLTAKHNGLQTESEKKEAALQEMQNHATTLQKENEKLQEVNKGLTKQLSCLRISKDQHDSDVSRQLKQLKKDYQKSLQEKEVIKHQLLESVKAKENAKGIQETLSQEIVQIRMECDIECGKVIVLEEEIQHHQRNYNNLIKEQEHLLEDKANQDQRLQREIQERLCLKMVNDLLIEESTYVKEAFQKLEKSGGSMDHRSKDVSPNQEEMPTPSRTDQMESIKNWNGDLLSKVTVSKSHCEELESQLSSLGKANRLLKTEKENLERQLQFVKMQEDAFTNQLSKSKALKMEKDNLKMSFDSISKRNKELENMLKYQKEEANDLKQELKELSYSTTESPQEKSVHCLQDEVDKIKETVTRLESEKNDLISEVRKLQKDQEMWTSQKSELEMSVSELNAENMQLRVELQSTKVVKTELSTDDIMNKIEREKEEAVRKTREEFKESFDEVYLELQTVKSELSKVWHMLEEKEKEVEHRGKELHQEKQQSQKLAQELVKLRKDYADLTTKSASRSQMICTLRDEIMLRSKEVIALETEISTMQQKCNTLEKPRLQQKNHGLKRRRSDGDIRSHGNFHLDYNEIKKLTSLNTQLNKRVQEVRAERESVLQDAQDLLNGMQQLKEAFEEEVERELERERVNFEKEKQSLQIAYCQKADKEPFGVKTKLETEVTQLTKEKNALEMKSKNLECERDELRDQVEELCKMRMAAEEKGVQVDPALSPRKRENKTSTRKRSKSIGVIVRPNISNPRDT